ncbi:ABC transporter ATP-binding protein [Oceanobacillus arenosus]|uniref:ABC transporter ATP-binding protein n=1 Tax=Oceanobacillus arenosus TaxID=1229153 RepID=A0A3D8PJ00_9BACI|nr:ABC transporter ATP-binding protein [Oceanobacillus arenosus]RDW16034.1 ABC transporter ATP-binding protein [Oceanobacillus arenosus]
MAIIEVDNLTKDFGYGRGIYSVSFQIQKGEVFGFLGPNGAGKTTTIRHLMGFTNPQQGHAAINGMRCNEQTSEILRDVGYLPGEIALPEGLTGWEFIKMMQGLKNSHNEERLQYLLDKFQLDPSGKTKRMSLGDKRKLAVVTAFMADPDILLLDEPTSGLDPVMQQTFIDFMKEEKKRGKTILLSSHMFGEIDAICDRIAIIKEGKIISTVNTDEIRHNINKIYQITFTTREDLDAFTKETHLTISLTEQDKHMAEVVINDMEINQLVKVLTNYQVMNFKEKKFSLEDYFMHFYVKGA